MTDKLVKKTPEEIFALQKTIDNYIGLHVSNKPDVVKKENDFGAEIAALVHKAGTIKLTEKQKGILYARVKEEDVEIRPDGLIYLPWMEYETRLREAFGMEYALIPQGLPRLENNLVLWGHWLIIKGCPMGFSIGQQEYYPSNKTMNWGDAIEGSKSNARMRLCKGLGITLELWKPSWVKTWIAEYAETYMGVDRFNKPKKYWRKKIVVTTVKIPKEIIEERNRIDMEAKNVATEEMNRVGIEDENIITEEMQEEMNKIDKKAESSQINPESTQAQELTLTPEEKKETVVPQTEEEIQGKVIDLAQEVTGEEIPYICAVKDGFPEAQFGKILEINKSHYLTDNEHGILKSYLLSGKKTKKDAGQCIDYLLERVQFYAKFEKKLIDEGLVADRDVAQKVILGIIEDISDIAKVRKNMTKIIDMIKEKMEEK